MRKGTGHPTSHADGSGYVSFLTGTPLRTKVYGTTSTLYIYIYIHTYIYIYSVMIIDYTRVGSMRFI